MTARGGVQRLDCVGCGDPFERAPGPGRRSELCPACRRIRRRERDRRRSAQVQARKLEGLPREVRCQDCGEAVEGYRRGQRGGVPKYCRGHASERRKERNRRSARESYERRKAGRREPAPPPSDSRGRMAEGFPRLPAPSCETYARRRVRAERIDALLGTGAYRASH